MKYYSLQDMLNMIDEPNRNACQSLYTDNESLFKVAQGSTYNHQAWIGGYHDHIMEVMNICVLLYPVYSLRELNFTLSDALLVMFLHDIEKPWKYENVNGSIRVIEKLNNKEKCHLFRQNKLIEYKFILSDKQQNALKYVEGEFNDYSSKERVMNELAAFCHIADMTSSRIFWAYGKLQWNK